MLSTPQRKATIIISSYNYDRYLAQAIDSALRLDWPDIEVIVIDDGSTDSSPELIRSYGDQITPIFQANSGRVHACNVGFAEAKGEVVVFLDSDDVLHPDLLKEASLLWSPQVSKVQCQMAVIDANGAFTGQIMPSFAVSPTAELIRQWCGSTSSYPTPFGSGNVYAKSFLDQIFPLDPNAWDSSDSCCLAAAPFFGDVKTIISPLVKYRVHGRNASLHTNIDLSLIRNEIVRAKQRSEYSRSIAATKGISLDSDIIYRSVSFASNRIISFRLAPDLHPIKEDTKTKIMMDGLRSYMSPQGISRTSRFVQLLFLFAVCVLPKGLARTAILWRLVPSSRPRSRLIAAVQRPLSGEARRRKGAKAAVEAR